MRNPLPRYLPLYIVCLLLGLAITQALFGSASAEEPPLTVTTSDGKSVEGFILSDRLSIQTAFGAKQIDAQKISLLSPAGMNLTDGTRLTGSVAILEGQVRVQTDKGIVVIPGRLVYSIQGRGGYLSTAQPAGPIPGEGDGESAASLLLGRWQDSNGVTWEFLKDGTVTQGSMAVRYSFPDHRHLKLHLGQAAAGIGQGVGMGQAFMPMVGGIGLDRVYDIASASHSRVVLKYQGNDLTLTRMRQ